MSHANFSSPREAARAFTPKLAAFVDDTLYPKIWNDPALALRDRSLITVAALIAEGHLDELPSHLRRALANGGRLIQVGILGGGGNVSVELEQILYRHLQIMGTVMKSRPQEEKHAMVRRFREHWLDRFAGGTSLEPVVDSTFELARAADAHRRMESSANVGKITLTM
jgi:NADPH:quinone reductase-like Zn-dependent oxidoreductase